MINGMSSKKQKDNSGIIHESQIIHRGPMIRGDKMSQDDINKILPLIKIYHPVIPEIINAYYGSNFYTLILREDDGIYHETYQYLSEELTRTFRAKIDYKKYDIKKLIYLIPSAASFYVTIYYGGSNWVLSIGGLLSAALFFFMAVNRD